MEKSKIYDLLNKAQLDEWKENIEQTQNADWYVLREKELLQELETQLSEQQKSLLKLYALAIENKLNYISYNIKIKLLNLGIKIGMELEESFAEYEE